MRPPGSDGPSSPPLLLLLSLTLPAAVDDLGGCAKLAEPQSPKTQLKVLGDLPSFGPDLLQPLDGRFGQGEVADGGTWLHPNAAVTHGREVTLGPDYHLVLARVQETPVVSVSS